MAIGETLDILKAALRYAIECTTQRDIRAMIDARVQFERLLPNFVDADLDPE